MADIIEQTIFDDGYIVILFEYHGKYLPKNYDRIYYVFHEYTDYDRILRLSKYQDLPYWKFIEKSPNPALDTFDNYNDAKKRYDYIVKTHKVKAKPKKAVVSAEIINITAKRVDEEHIDILVAIKNNGNVVFNALVEGVPDGKTKFSVRARRKIPAGETKIAILKHVWIGFIEWIITLYNADNGLKYDEKRYVVKHAEIQPTKPPEKPPEKPITLLELIEELIRRLLKWKIA